MRADKSATLEEQLRWLEGAGFDGVECRRKDHRFAVYGGRKGKASLCDGKEK